MQPDTVQLFTALLTVFVLAGTVAVWSARLTAHRSTSASQLLDLIRPHRTTLATAIAAASMAGSLYFSEVANYLPCTLCWYQRIAMYPLAILGVVAVIRHERATAYLTTLAGIGLPISLYHWLLERFPDIDAGVCSVTVPCEFVWFEKFGFVTLPFMALTGFAAILSLVTLQERP